MTYEPFPVTGAVVIPDAEVVVVITIAAVIVIRPVVVLVEV